MNDVAVGAPRVVMSLDVVRPARRWPIRRRIRWSWPLLLVAGCPAGEDTPSEDSDPVLLAVIDGWERVTDPTRDVFFAVLPSDSPCDESGVGVEEFGLSFEVKTDLCNDVTVAQLTRTDLVAGDEIRIRTWHDVLQSPTPGEGYVGIALAGEIIWEVDVPIPSSYDTINADVVIDGDHPKGTELQFHVHNHGANSWNLLDLQRVPKGGR